MEVCEISLADKLTALAKQCRAALSVIYADILDASDGR
jgi:hypothetical protein